MGNEIVLIQPDEGELKGKGVELVAQAQGLVINDTATYENAGAWLVDVKGIGKRLMARFAEPCSKAQAAWKSMVKMRDEALAPFELTERIIKDKMGKYQWEVEAKRQEETRRAEEKALKKAEEERARQIAEARRLKDKEAVEALKAAPIEVQAVAPKTQEAPKVQGVSYRKVWKVQSVDAAKLPLRYLMPDMKAIESTVRGLGAKHGIPGVTVVEETVTSVRG